MELLQVEWKDNKQKSLVIQLLKELQIKFRTVLPQNETSELYGLGFKQSILDAKQAYDAGDTTQFVKVKRDELWK